MAARRKKSGGGGIRVAAALGVFLAVAGGSHGHGHGILATLTSLGGASRAQAISYAWGRVGLPYCWGGTGPSCYDCSGLVYEAYGQSIPRTSQAQWASLPHVNHPRPGDLVFGVGSLQPGEKSPGHVGLVIGGGRVIQAYATGYNIAPVSLSQFANGAGGIVGYARPGGA